MARSIARGQAWTFLADLPNRFTNMAQSMKWLVSQGMGYHAQTMQDDVRTAFQSFTKKPLQETFSGFDRLPQNLFIEKDWKRPETYNYYGNAYFIDPVTKEESFRSYSLYADTSLSDFELAELVYGIEESREEEYGPGWKVSRFESLERSHKWGAPRSEGYGIAEI